MPMTQNGQDARERLAQLDALIKRLGLILEDERALNPSYPRRDVLCAYRWPEGRGRVLFIVDRERGTWSEYVETPLDAEISESEGNIRAMRAAPRLLAAVDGLLPYALKLAELNEEPEGGDCRRQIAEAEALMAFSPAKATVRQVKILLREPFAELAGILDQRRAELAWTTEGATEELRTEARHKARELLEQAKRIRPSATFQERQNDFEAEARVWGRMCQAIGHDANPYASGTKARRAWAEGWRFEASPPAGTGKTTS